MIDFYVIYDLKDNIIGCFQNESELKRFLPRYRLKDLKYRLKKKNPINVYIDKEECLIYKEEVI